MSNNYNKMIVNDIGICMIVNDSGICQRLYIDDNTFCDKIVITKEAFIEAYNRYIKET